MSTNPYGTAVWCLDSQTPGRLAKGVNVVAQACYRRLMTPRGTLRGGEEEQNYGIDLPGLVGSMPTAEAISQLPSRIRGELAKDERVSDVAVTITQVVNSDKSVALVFEIRVTLHDSTDGFSLVLSVSDVTTELLRIG